jgi:hypothetical protein
MKGGKPVDLDEENEKIYKDWLYIFGRTKKYCFALWLRLRRHGQKFYGVQPIDGDGRGVETVLEAPISC